MKYKKSIFLLIIFVCSLFYPTFIYGQKQISNNLLQEKTTLASDSESVVYSTTNKDSKEYDTFTWASIIVSIMLVGLFLLFLEIAIIPGVGITGVSGTILLIVSLGMAFWKLNKVWAVGVTVTACIGVVALVLFMFFGLPHTRLGKKFILSQSAPNPEEISAVDDTSKFIGAVGIAVSNLRPSGIAKIEGERLTVITEGDFIEKNTKIKVIKSTAGQIIVTSLEEKI